MEIFPWTTASRTLPKCTSITTAPVGTWGKTNRSTKYDLRSTICELRFKKYELRFIKLEALCTPSQTTTGLCSEARKDKPYFTNRKSKITNRKSYFVIRTS